MNRLSAPRRSNRLPSSLQAAALTCRTWILPVALFFGLMAVSPAHADDSAWEGTWTGQRSYEEEGAKFTSMFVLFIDQSKQGLRVCFKSTFTRSSDYSREDRWSDTATSEYRILYQSTARDKSLSGRVQMDDSSFNADRDVLRLRVSCICDDPRYLDTATYYFQICATTEGNIRLFLITQEEANLPRDERFKRITANINDRHILVNKGAF